MSSKQTTQQTNQYNPASMNAFNALTPGIQSVLQGYMTDPFNQKGGNPFYNMALQQGLKGNQQLSQGMLSNLTRNLSSGGFGGGNMPGFQQAMLAQAGRQSAGMNSQTFLNNALNAQQLQLGATNMAANYKPLQTGSNTVQQTSGLGTWLPGLIGAGLQAGAAFATGGGSLAASLGKVGLSSGIGAAGNIIARAAGPAGNPGAFTPTLTPGYGGFGGNSSVGANYNPFGFGVGSNSNPFGGMFGGSMGGH